MAAIRQAKFKVSDTPDIMKTLASAIIASAAASLVSAANFTEVTLDAPLNWVVGTYLWPAEIIAGYNDVVDGSNWTDSTWDAYVLAECETYTACTSSITWQGVFDGPLTAITTPKLTS